MSEENHLAKNKEQSMFTGKGSRKAMFMGFLVGLFLLCIMVFFNQRNAPTYSEYAIHTPMELGQFVGDSELSNLGVHAFNSQDYDAAAHHLKKLAALSRENKIPQLYYGISLLEIDKIATATTVFSAISSGETPLNYTAQWYTALGYLKAGKLEWCIAVLEEIPSEATEFMKAQELLKRF
ncbi:MAG: hypothetical protein COB81_00580 [Flavobacteriaceae bacterium]|nr:MAG: hypothetical protein COB81_00580 [Flavobacteriaceae bacterium]